MCIPTVRKKLIRTVGAWERDVLPQKKAAPGSGTHEAATPSQYPAGALFTDPQEGLRKPGEPSGPRQAAGPSGVQMVGVYLLVSPSKLALGDLSVRTRKKACLGTSVCGCLEP